MIESRVWGFSPQYFLAVISFGQNIAFCYSLLSPTSCTKQLNRVCMLKLDFKISTIGYEKEASLLPGTHKMQVFPHLLSELN